MKCKCPMTFGDPCSDRNDDCRGSDCCWYVRIESNGRYTEGCAVAFIPTAAHIEGKWSVKINHQEYKEEE